MARAIIKEPDDGPMPTKIRLTCPYGFYDDDGKLHMWQAGQEVTDADEIKTLINGGAEHEDLE